MGGVFAEHPLAPGVPYRTPETLEGFWPRHIEGTGPLLFRAVLDGEEQGDHVHRVVRVEVGEEEAVHSERVEAGAEHTAHRPRAEVEDEHLPTALDRDAALPPLQAGDDRSGTHDRDLHVFLPSGIPRRPASK